MKNGKAIKALLVEDDSDDYRLLMRELGDSRYSLKVDWAVNLSEAAEKLKLQEYDIVLTDLSLPESSGLETVAKLRAFVGDLPMIVLTSLDDECLGHDLLECGAQDYLVKGELKGRSIIRALQHAIQRQRMQNELTLLLKEREQNQLLLDQQSMLLKDKNRRLEQLYNTGQEFVDNVSHDFRTPLTVIKDYVAIIREGMVGDINSEQQRMLDKVSVRADDLNNMVDDLLDVSKLEAGLLGAWRRNVSVSEIVERIESMLRQRAETKGVEFELDCDSTLPEVYCDADMISRVITNLAVNAIKFAGENGRVRLWAKADLAQNQVIVGVSDTGLGIDAESLEAIFQRFNQEDSRVKTADKGFGLGLSIAVQFCRLNLGELSVESSEGKGSTFSFNIPIADPKEVLSRWLRSQCSAHESLQLKEITLNEGTTLPSANEFDHFLNCLLRKQDLLFRTETSRWMLVMALPQCESDNWESRLDKEFRKHNRNRPMGPLAKYHMRARGAWNSEEHHDAILGSFCEGVGRYATA